MTKLVLHEIDGTDTVIMADLADDHFIMIGPLAQEKCLAKDIHLYKSQDETYYLADREYNILATGMSTIRTYINYLV